MVSDHRNGSKLKVSPINAGKKRNSCLDVELLLFSKIACLFFFFIDLSNEHSLVQGIASLFNGLISFILFPWNTSHFLILSTFLSCYF